MRKFSITMLLLLTLLSLLLAACGGPAAPAAPVAEDSLSDLPVNVSPAQVASLYTNPDVVIIDVREQWEYDEGHIPGANLIPLGSISERMNEIPQDKTVIAVCRSGNRSGQATQFLRGQGFDNVHNMNGGMIDWQSAGYPVER